jgi:hypothetical protein
VESSPIRNLVSLVPVNLKKQRPPDETRHHTGTSSGTLKGEDRPNETLLGVLR